MSDVLEKLSYCVEFGKIDKNSPYPPDMKGQDGADELTKQALDNGVKPIEVLNKALVPGMDKVGKKFAENKVFVPQMLMSAKAMSKGMDHLKPFFLSGDVKRKGTFIVGTVAGDLHDIGKNLVAMMVEGGGWEVIDLGTDVKTEQFIESLKQHPGSMVGLSALLTTTMVNMADTVKKLKEEVEDVKVLIGGAPVNDEFREKIGADFYSPNPQGAVEYLNSVAV
jgi:corrinoid protein of di/trimethylamine methyltransferase